MNPHTSTPITTWTATHGAVQIQVRDCGQGPLIVLLPSLGRDVEDFIELAQQLAAHGCRVLLPSPRGMGASTGPAPATLHALADDIAAVIRAANAGPALVAGHAFGNWVARVLAIDHPAHVWGIALLAAAQRGAAATWRQRLDACMDLSLPTAERLAHLQAVFFAPGHDASEWLDGWYPEVARQQRQASAATPEAGWWQAGTVPVLDLQADDDVFAPASGRQALREALGADRVQVVCIPQAGHALVPEQPAAVAQALVDFLQQQQPVQQQERQQEQQQQQPPDPPPRATPPADQP